MKHFKAHWRIFSIALVVAIGGAGALWWYGCDRATSTAFAGGGGGGEFVALDAVTQDGVNSALGYMSLDHAALVALDLSAQDAETVYSSVRTWYLANEGTLATLHATVDQAVAALRAQQASIAMGPPEEGQDEALATAISTLATARAAYDDAFDSVRAGIFKELSGGQQSIWSAIQGGLGQQMPIRMLALTADQRLELSRAWHRFQWQRGAASDEEELATAVSAWETTMAEILTAGQETTVASFASGFSSSSGVVLTAWATVFPSGVQS
jgi:hypothetical protein